MLMKLRAVLAALIAIFLSPAFAEDEKPVPATLDELKEAISTVMEEHKVPAVGIAMVDADGETWVGSLGKANLENDIAADADTMYRIGSTSKMFVALSVLKLVEQGRLSLDDRVADLAPEIEFQNPWEETDPVRVVHLLEHTTGWDDIHLPEYAHNDPTPVTLKEGLDFHPHSRISRWKPGSRMAYCNAGPPVAAYIVQTLTGLDFEDYVQFNFFDPLGMETASYRLNETVRERGATLYSNGKAEDYWHLVMRPSGAINASPRDMAKFARFFLDRGKVDDWSLVSDESLRRMERAETTSGAAAGLEVGYGLHNYASSHEHWVYRVHDGGVNGGLTEFAYLPEAGVGHAIMINSGNGSAFREISRLLRAFETKDLAAPPVESEWELTERNHSIAGYYYPINPRQQVAFFIERVFNVRKLWFEDGKLVERFVLPDEPTRYIPLDDDRYASAKTGKTVLVRAQDPLAGEVVHIGSNVLKPVSGVQVYLQFAVLALWGLFMAGSILFAPVWIVRRLRSKIPPGVAVRVRLWPLLAALSVVVFLGLFMIGMGDPFTRLGAPTFVSVGVMVSTVSFALFSVFGVMCAYWSRNAGINRVVYWHSATASTLNVVVTAYLLAHGVIGLMTWA